MEPHQSSSDNSSTRLPTVNDSVIGGHSGKAVDGREIHRYLQVGKDYSTWMKDRIAKYGFIEGVDYEKFEDLSSPNSGSAKSRPQATIEYVCTLGMGKELGMVDRSPRGRAIRKYFIEVEEAQTSPGRAMSPAEMFMSSAQLLLRLEQQATALQQQTEAQAKALEAIGSRVEMIADTAPLKAKPQNTETISEVRARINRKYGLPSRIVNDVMFKLSYSLRPFAMVRNAHEDAQGSSFAVYQILDVTKLFARFVSECEQITATTCSHPAIDGRFKLTKNAA